MDSKNPICESTSKKQEEQGPIENFSSKIWNLCSKLSRFFGFTINSSSPLPSETVTPVELKGRVEEVLPRSHPVEECAARGCCNHLEIELDDDQAFCNIQLKHSSKDIQELCRQHIFDGPRPPLDSELKPLIPGFNPYRLQKDSLSASRSGHAYFHGLLPLTEPQRFPSGKNPWDPPTNLEPSNIQNTLGIGSKSTESEKEVIMSVSFG